MKELLEKDGLLGFELGCGQVCSYELPAMMHGLRRFILIDVGHAFAACETLSKPACLCEQAKIICAISQQPRIQHPGVLHKTSLQGVRDLQAKQAMARSSLTCCSIGSC